MSRLAAEWFRRRFVSSRGPRRAADSGNGHASEPFEIPFRDRREAGRALARWLRAYAGRTDVLVEIATEIGLDPAAVERFLEGERFLAEAEQEDRSARRLGISGVPCFIFNERYALSGAQEPEAFFQLFDLARVDEQMAAETW